MIFAFTSDFLFSAMHLSAQREIGRDTMATMLCYHGVYGEVSPASNGSY